MERDVARSHLDKLQGWVFMQRAEAPVRALAGDTATLDGSSKEAFMQGPLVWVTVVLREQSGEAPRAAAPGGCQHLWDDRTRTGSRVPGAP